MMFSYPYFKPPYYHRYSRYGYYYPNPYYANKVASPNVNSQQPSKKYHEDTKSEIKQGHNCTRPTSIPFGRCPYN